MPLLSLIVEGGSREPGACFERCRESPPTRMFREGQNSKAAIDVDVVQQDDDGAVEHFQQHAPGQALHTSGTNLTTINSVAFRWTCNPMVHSASGSQLSSSFIDHRASTDARPARAFGCILNVLCSLFNLYYRL
jgi:hypothetical protein